MSTAPSNVANVGMNTCGVLVHANPNRIARVAEALAGLPGVEVHETASGGRIVVTVEDTPSTLALDTLGSIHRLDGVIAAALVFHHFDQPSQDVGSRAASAA